MERFGMQMMTHLCQRWLFTTLLTFLIFSLANEAMAESTELANRYLSSRPELYGAGILVAIGVVPPSRTAIIAEGFEAGILRLAKMLSSANDWNATHPRWQRVVEKIRDDFPHLMKAAQEDSRLHYDSKSDELWRKTFVQTLALELGESDLRAIVEFYESLPGKRFGAAAKRVLDLAQEQKARMIISRAKGEPYNMSGLAELFSRPMDECEVCTPFSDRETLGVATGFPLLILSYKELLEAWQQLLSEEDRLAIQAFRSSGVAERERKAMRKGSFAIRATAPFKEFVRAQREASDAIEAPYLKSWRELMQDSGDVMSAP